MKAVNNNYADLKSNNIIAENVAAKMNIAYNEGEGIGLHEIWPAINTYEIICNLWFHHGDRYVICCRK